MALTDEMRAYLAEEELDALAAGQGEDSEWWATRLAIERRARQREHADLSTREAVVSADRMRIRSARRELRRIGKDVPHIERIIALTEREGDTE